ncbi:MAG TPA: hypothetical protein VJT73_18605 [Polyangiaceae bacterium]|nr:hypothetical protein [Polyangiaceae bacterium]
MTAFSLLLLLCPESAWADPFIRFSAAPEWAFRRFRDSEPSTTDKSYAASGIPSLRFDVAIDPLRYQEGALRDLEFTFFYARALALTSWDIDTREKGGTFRTIDTSWWRYGAGVRYAAFRSWPVETALSLAIERSAFAFEVADPQKTEVPAGRYTLLRAGADGRLPLGRFFVLCDANVLLPVSIAPLGDREVAGSGLGLRAGAGAGFALIERFEAGLRFQYDLVTFSLPPLPNRNDEPGRVYDQYFIFSGFLALSL